MTGTPSLFLPRGRPVGAFGRGRLAWLPASLWLLLCGCGDVWVADGGTRPAQSPPACSSTDSGLIVNEMLPVPVGELRGRQWLELYNGGRQRICLGDATLQFGPPWQLCTRPLLFAPETGCLAPGDYLLLGDATPPQRLRRAGQPVAATWGEGALAGHSGVVRLLCRGVVVAAACYGLASCPAPEPARPHGVATAMVGAPLPRRGFSLARQKTPGSFPAHWCHAEGPRYDGYDTGSPGRANPPCALCRLPAGNWRARQRPHAGELVFWQIYPDPPGKDRDREWVEVANLGARSVDLLGLEMVAELEGRAARRWQLWAQACTPLAAGKRLRLPVRRRARPAPEGNSAGPVFWGPELPNRAMWLTLLDDDEALLARSFFARLPHHAAVPALTAPP